MKDLWWLIAIVVVIFIIWIFTGGPERFSPNKPYVEPIAPLGTGGTYGPQQ